MERMEIDWRSIHRAVDYIMGRIEVFTSQHVPSEKLPKEAQPDHPQSVESASRKPEGFEAFDSFNWD